MKRDADWNLQKNTADNRLLLNSSFL